MFTIIVLKSMIGETENAIDAICGWPRFLKNLSFDLKNIRLNSKTIKQLHLLKLPIIRLEGTKSVILSGPPCKDGNAWFTTVPWKNVEDTIVILFLFTSFSRVTFAEKPQMKINNIQRQKHWCLVHTWSDKAFKCTVVNRAVSSMHEGSHVISED